MAHPAGHLRRADRRRAGLACVTVTCRPPYSASLEPLHSPALQLGDELQAVADAENGHAQREDLGIDRRRARLVDAARSSREDEPGTDRPPVSRRPECRTRSVPNRPGIRARAGRSAASTGRRNRRPGPSSSLQTQASADTSSSCTSFANLSASAGENTPAPQVIRLAAPQPRPKRRHSSGESPSSRCTA